MDKSDDLSKNDGMSGISRISKEEERKEDEITDHKYHTHSNGQFPLATKT